MGAATTYDPGLSLREARTRYFIDNAFGGPEGNYHERWVKVYLGPVPVVFPNSAARVRAVRYHDLHHVLTGYATTMKGETEISAWELASGCRAMAAAWVLNLLGMAVGLWIDRKALFAAFVRGRYSGNLYEGEDLDAEPRHQPIREPERHHRRWPRIVGQIERHPFNCRTKILPRAQHATDSHARVDDVFIVITRVVPAAVRVASRGTAAHQVQARIIRVADALSKRLSVMCARD